MPDVIELTGEERVCVYRALEECKQGLDGFVAKLRQHIGHDIPSPAKVDVLWQSIEQAFRAIGDLSSAPIGLPGEHAPVIKTALTRQRRRIATESDRMRTGLISPELSVSVESRAATHSRLLAHPAIHEAVGVPMPTLAEFLTPEAVRRIDAVPVLAEREFEPKSRILLSSSLIAKDLAYHRSECEARGVPLAVAFADADHFKALNTRLGEPVVDRDVLPALMGAIERAIYGRGAAYRHGGDEFVLLMPNADNEAATTILKQVQRSLAETSLIGGEQPITLSIGCVVVGPNSELTDREIVERAAHAKSHAKQRRDAVALVGSRLTDIPGFT